MADSTNSPSGALICFCAAAFSALIAVASVAWVLAAPTVVDDQGTRATFAGWALGVLALVLSAILAAQGLRRTRTGDPKSAVVDMSIRQDISDQGTGNVGGTHFHGDVNLGDRS